MVVITVQKCEGTDAVYAQKTASDSNNSKSSQVGEFWKKVKHIHHPKPFGNHIVCTENLSVEVCNYRINEM